MAGNITKHSFFLPQTALENLTVWILRPLWRRGNIYFGQMIVARSRTVMTVMLGDMNEIERNAENYILENFPQ